MARSFGNAVTPSEVALVAATAKTVLMLTAPANQRVIVQRVGIFFDGTKSNNEPVLIQFYRMTDSGTFTSGSVADYQDMAHTFNTTMGYNATVEPTYGELIDSFNIHPQQGIEIILPLMQEMMISGGGRVGMVVTAPDAVNCIAKMMFEE
jgi:hypothetical protein